MKTLVFGAHPDDPESGCGGFAAQSVKAGHEVVFMYATAYRQGRQFFGRPEREVRTEEALSACEVIGVRGIILGFLHEGIDVNTQNVEKITEVLMKERPDVVIAHWPVDTHPDHRCVGTLALSAYLRPETDFEFYYFEVMTGLQSLHFHPTHYVDISDVAEVKHQALLCHKSQDGEYVWQDHELMHRFRGRECGVERAEAYIRIDRKKTAQQNLPGLKIC
jgi:LmbE family N-acetylglucosaminyl deacetylase